MAVLSNMYGKKVADLLGLPEETIWFELRVEVNEPITVKCEYYPKEKNFVNGSVERFFKEFVVHEREQEVPKDYGQWMNPALNGDKRPFEQEVAINARIMARRIKEAIEKMEKTRNENALSIDSIIAEMKIEAEEYRESRKIKNRIKRFLSRITSKGD